MEPPHTQKMWPQSRCARVLEVLLVLAVIWCFRLPATGMALSPGTNLEAKVKAAYIFNFLTFVSWELDEKRTEAGTVKICVLGEDPVFDLLSELSRQQIRGHTLDVQSIRDVSNIANCHMLVIGRSESSQLQQVLASLQGKSILTVSDIPGFSHEGGVIGFVKEGGRIKLEINQRAAAQAKLKISAKLLELARIVQ